MVKNSAKDETEVEEAYSDVADAVKQIVPF